MGSIYNISAYKNTVDYVENDIVVKDNQFFYTLQANGPSSTVVAPMEGSGFWEGILTLPPDNEQRPYFYWKPSYSMAATHTPKVKTVKYGDGYQQRMKDGINNSLLQFSLKFSNIGVKKATAILHFLTARDGVEYFYFKPPAPYSVYKRFICTGFTSDNSFVNNFNITAKFQEVAP